MVIKVGGRGDGWVSYFGKFCNPFQFAKFVFYNDLTKKYLVSFVYYHTSRIAKSRVDCRNPDSWYSLTFLYFYGLFLIYKSQKRRQKFCSNTCSNLFTRNPYTPQRLVFNYFIFSTSLFQPFNLITVTKSATLDSKSDKRHFEYGKSIIWISVLMSWQVVVTLLSYALYISLPRRKNLFADKCSSQISDKGLHTLV